MTAYVPPSDMDAERPQNLVRISAVVIVVLAALVASASYFAGRAVRPGEDARARVAVPPTVQAAAAPPPAAERESTRPRSPFADFNLALLHPQVAEAVTQARLVQEEAIAAALRGEAAARRARAGAQGTSVIMYDGGDVYAGETIDGDRQGAGVYTWSNPQEDNYAGDFVDDAMDGLGIKRWTDGATYYGDRRREAREGYGVFVDSMSGGYEGAWRNGAPDGYGVVWNPDGSVKAQGLWAGNTLVEAWVIPTPVPTTDPADAAPGAAALADGAGVDSSVVGVEPGAAGSSDVSADAETAVDAAQAVPVAAEPAAVVDGDVAEADSAPPEPAAAEGPVEETAEP